jgi:hypothetical protein
MGGNDFPDYKGTLPAQIMRKKYDFIDENDLGNQPALRSQCMAPGSGGASIRPFLAIWRHSFGHGSYLIAQIQDVGS